MIRKIKNFWVSLDETTIISKREMFLEIVAVAFAGLVLGMLLTPKKTVTIGRNNAGGGCSCGNASLDDADEEAEV